VIPVIMENSSMEVDYDKLHRHLTENFRLGIHTIHGPDHWERVEQYGIYLAGKSGVNITVVRLFALFHDSCRETDSIDFDHGIRGAKLAESLRSIYFTVTDPEMEQLLYACRHHTDGEVTDDLTIGCCWDADRLDLGRAHITPKESLMSTLAAKELVRNDRVGKKFFEWCEE